MELLVTIKEMYLFKFSLILCFSRTSKRKSSRCIIKDVFHVGFCELSCGSRGKHAHCVRVQMDIVIGRFRSILVFFSTWMPLWLRQWQHEIRKFGYELWSLYVIERPSKVFNDKNNTVCCLLIVIFFQMSNKETEPGLCHVFAKRTLSRVLGESCLIISPDIDTIVFHL